MSTITFRQSIESAHQYLGELGERIDSLSASATQRAALDESLAALDAALDDVMAAWAESLRDGQETTQALLDAPTDAVIRRNITERKRAEKAFHEAEVRYRSLFDDSPVSLWEEDFSDVKAYIDNLRDSGISDFRSYFEEHPEAVRHCATLVKIVDVNQATVEIFRAGSKEDLLANLARLFIDESYQAFKEELIALAVGETRFACKIIGRPITGEPIDCEVLLTIASGYEESWDRIIVSVTDITERKLAEEEQKKLARDLSERVKELNCLYGITRLIQTPNISLEEILQGTVDLIPPAWLHPVCSRMTLGAQVFSAQNFAESEHRLIRDIVAEEKRVGTLEIHYLGNIPDDREPFLEEEVSLIDAIAKRLGRIIERLWVQERLQQQNRFVTSVLEALTHPFYVINAQDYTLTMANRAALREETLEGLSCHVLTHQRDEPCDPVDCPCPLKTVRETKTPTMTEHVHHTQGGETKIIEVYGYPLLDNDGNVTQMIEYTLDITERKQAEAALRHRIEIEELATSISTYFINLPVDHVDVSINNALELVGGFLGADRGYLTFLSRDKATMRCTHGWHAGGAETHFDDLQDLRVTALPWLVERIRCFEITHIPQLADLPPEASAEKALFEAHDIQSLMVVPVTYGGDVTGFIGLSAAQVKSEWVAEDVTLLKLVGEIFTNALARRQTVEALAREAEINANLAALSTALVQAAPIEEISTLVLGHAQRLTDSRFGFAGYVDPNTGSLLSSTLTGDISDSCEAISKEVVFEEFKGLWEWVLENREPLMTNALSDDSRSTAIPPGRIPIERFLSAPAMIGDVLVGQAAIANSSRDYTEQDMEIVKRLAALYAIAIQRNRTEIAEREQRALAEALRDTAAVLGSTLDFDEVLDRILSNVGEVVPHDAASITLIEGDFIRYARFQGYTKYDLDEWMGKQRFRLVDFPNLERMKKSKFSISIPDTHADEEWVIIPETDWVCSYVGTPICIDGEVVGFLQLDSTKPNAFSDEHAERLQAFADQAVIAIQNARAYAQAQALATMEERQRLARDLHDAVSQTLFSASVMAEALPRLWDRNPDDVHDGLLELRRMTKGALAEMRTLLLELRPAVLTETPLGDLVRQLVDATIARTQIAVDMTLEGNYVLPQDAQITVYRLAQEALSNVVKHARAGHLTVSLRGNSERIALTITDNGRGFDPENVPPDRLGLGIMGERAASIGAKLRVVSQIDQGTEVRVTWQGSREKTDND